ncbi:MULTISPECIES: lipoprotein insertase outer membrane protein LolB [Luteimonas]|uniref:lipoprotein insertase outer membrane protein LolB n=1 Tax=Luteimonas TaxID=83614 RepID=UPI000C7AAC79|nr:MULTISPECIES: lipoprotein insertase outer membrane protein LolB [Luteimonas]
MRRVLLRGIAALSLVVLAACSSVPVRPPPVVADQLDPAAVAAQQARRDWLQAHPDWQFEGRVAVSQAGRGGSGRVDWQQTGPTYTVALSAPVTRQSWRLLADRRTGAGRIEGLAGGPREGPSAEALVLDATGWLIPVAQLPDWARGLVVDADAAGASRIAYDAEGRPQIVEQQDWTVAYLDWHPAEGERPALPRRIDATRGDATVRVIVDSWDFSAP